MSFADYTIPICEELLESYKERTLTAPLCYHIFSRVTLDSEDIGLCERALREYRQEDSDLTDAVVLGSEFWYNEFVKATRSPIGDGIKVPNGCCTAAQCGIGRFYAILHRMAMEAAMQKLNSASSQ